MASAGGDVGAIAAVIFARTARYLLLAIDRLICLRECTLTTQETTSGTAARTEIV